VEDSTVDLPAGGEPAGRPAAALVLAGGELVVTIVPRAQFTSHSARSSIYLLFLRNAAGKTSDATLLSSRGG